VEPQALATQTSSDAQATVTPSRPTCAPLQDTASQSGRELALYQGQCEELKAQLAQQRADTVVLRSQCGRLTAELDTAQAALQARDGEAAALRARAAALEQAEKQLRRQVAWKDRSLSDLQQQHAALAAQLAEARRAQQEAAAGEAAACQGGGVAQQPAGMAEQAAGGSGSVASGSGVPGQLPAEGVQSPPGQQQHASSVPRPAASYVQQLEAELAEAKRQLQTVSFVAASWQRQFYRACSHLQSEVDAAHSRPGASGQQKQPHGAAADAAAAPPPPPPAAPHPADKAVRGAPQPPGTASVADLSQQLGKLAVKGAGGDAGQPPAAASEQAPAGSAERGAGAGAASSLAATDASCQQQGSLAAGQLHKPATASSKAGTVVAAAAAAATAAAAAREAALTAVQSAAAAGGGTSGTAAVAASSDAATRWGTCWRLWAQGLTSRSTTPSHVAIPCGLDPACDPACRPRATPPWRRRRCRAADASRRGGRVSAQPACFLLRRLMAADGHPNAPSSRLASP
jgi:hypothetical protein